LTRRMNRRDAMRALMALPAVTRIAQATVEPGDVIVIEVPGALTVTQQKLIAEQLRGIWPANQVLVLQNGMQLKIGTTVGAIAAKLNGGGRR
jgi:hypothetical protein